MKSGFECVGMIDWLRIMWSFQFETVRRRAIDNLSFLEALDVDPHFWYFAHFKKSEASC